MFVEHSRQTRYHTLNPTGALLHMCNSLCGCTDAITEHREAPFGRCGVAMRWQVGHHVLPTTQRSTPNRCVDIRFSCWEKGKGSYWRASLSDHLQLTTHVCWNELVNFLPCPKMYVVVSGTISSNASRALSNQTRRLLTGQSFWTETERTIFFFFSCGGGGPSDGVFEAGPCSAPIWSAAKAQMKEERNRGRHSANMCKHLDFQAASWHPRPRGWG